MWWVKRFAVKVLPVPSGVAVEASRYETISLGVHIFNPADEVIGVEPSRHETFSWLKYCDGNQI